jgi:hypothetical protein
LGHVGTAGVIDACLHQTPREGQGLLEVRGFNVVGQAAVGIQPPVVGAAEHLHEGKEAKYPVGIPHGEAAEGIDILPGIGHLHHTGEVVVGVAHRGVAGFLLPIHTPLEHAAKRQAGTGHTVDLAASPRVLPHRGGEGGKVGIIVQSAARQIGCQIGKGALLTGLQV